MAGGSALVLSGLITYPVPGPPSTLMILVGFTLIAQEWEWLARVLDGADLRLEPRRRRAVAAWRGLQLPTKLLVGACALALLVAAAYGAYRLVYSG